MYEVKHEIFSLLLTEDVLKFARRPNYLGFKVLLSRAAAIFPAHQHVTRMILYVTLSKQNTDTSKMSTLFYHPFLRLHPP